MTKIIFERFGGFLESPIALVLDVNALSPREAKYIMYLIEEADFFRFPEDLVDESAEHKNNTYIIELYASFKDHLEQGAFAQLKIMEEGDKVKIYRPKSNRKSIRIFDFLKEIELIEKIEEWQDQVCSPEKIFEDEKTMISYRYAK